MQPAPQSDSIVQIGLVGYNVDGTSSVSASGTEPSLSSIVYTSGTLCRVGAGDRLPPPDAAHAWKFSGTLLSKSAEEAVLQLTWQRVLDQGKAVAGPENTTQLTLRAGDRVALDSVLAESPGCSASATFEARYGPRNFLTATFATPATGASRWSSGSGTGSGSGVGRSVPGKAAAGPAIAAPMQVDLWLVHRAPGRLDEVFHKVVRAGGEDTEFTFPPVSIATPRGNADVQVSGSFRVTPQRQLVFLTNRRVTHSGSAGGEPDVNTGHGKSVRDLPTSDEVLSFDMPSIQVAGSKDMLPDQFSIRLRVSSGRN